MGFIIVLLPYSVQLPFRFIKLKNARSKYFLSKIAKREFIERKFNLPNKRISLEEIKREISKSNDKYY